MALKEGKSKHGVRFRYHKTRKHGATRDRYWTIRHTVDGKQVEEGLGYTSEGMTETKAIALGVEFKTNKKVGIRPQSMKEKRELLAEQEREDAEALQKDKNVNKPFDNFFYEFLDYREKEDERPASEIKKSQYQYEKYIKPVIGNMPARKIKTINLKGVDRAVKRAGLSLRSRMGIIGLISQVYHHHIDLEDDAYSGVNPVKRKKIFTAKKEKKLNNRRSRYLTHDEAHELLAALPTQIRTMALLSLHMGCRAGEIMSIRWADVNDSKIFIPNPKNQRPRTLVMSEEVKKAISSMVRGRNNEYLFLRPGTSAPYKRVPKVFQTTVDKLGFNDHIEDRRQKVVFHTLRHTCASWLVRAGVDLYTVKEVLGHSSITVTERYVHEGARFAEAANVMDSISASNRAFKEKVCIG